VTQFAIPAVIFRSITQAQNSFDVYAKVITKIAQDPTFNSEVAGTTKSCFMLPSDKPTDAKGCIISVSDDNDLGAVTTTIYPKVIGTIEPLSGGSASMPAETMENIITAWPAYMQRMARLLIDDLAEKEYLLRRAFSPIETEYGQWGRLVFVCGPDVLDVLVAENA
jgi:hypothetical protein